jgi:hypothetical protein
MPLPEGLQFLKLGWWVVHAMGVLLVYWFAYQRGRGDERRRQRIRDMETRGSLERPKPGPS